MREVAALAGVSIKTVSRVVNREGVVSPDLTARVSAAIDRLDYRLNMTASTLRRRSSIYGPGRDEKLKLVVRGRKLRRPGGDARSAGSPISRALPPSAPSSD